MFFKLFNRNKDQKTEKVSVKESKFSISSKISKIFTHKQLDDETMQDLEDLLLSCDLGIVITEEIINKIKERKFEKNIQINQVKQIIAQEIIDILQPCAKQLQFGGEKKPQIIIFNGINGAGKTTTIGKIAQNLKNSGKKVVIAACDTFRAAATSQLEIWAKRSDSILIKAQKDGSDPASVAHVALKKAIDINADILLVDTAGRLQNKQDLMEELKKINKVLRKIKEDVEIENILVIDATNGQNSKSQLESFDACVNITGLIVTKLDGSSKAGGIVALANDFKKPIYACGIGERLEDLQDFDPQIFAKNLVGLD